MLLDDRGTGASQGKWDSWGARTQKDYADVLDWLQAQPWSDGTFGLYGSSYMGVTTLQAAVDGPPGLKAVFAYLTGSTYHHGWIRSGGVFELAINVRWTLAQLGGQHA